MKAVPIPRGSRANSVFWPMCVNVQRCGGCCDSDLFSCVPTSVKMVTFFVSRAACLLLMAMMVTSLLLSLRLFTCIIRVNMVLMLILDVRFFVFFTLVLFAPLPSCTVSSPICMFNVSHALSSPNSSISNV